MTEDEAQAWLTARWPQRMPTLRHYVTLLRAEAEHQSLIARSTFDRIWSRHIVDSAQLVPLAPARGAWLDIGSGGGLPGLVVAVLRDAPTVLCEPRRKRAAFLADAVARLGLTHTDTIATKVETLRGRFAVISARAVAPIGELMCAARQVVSRETIMLLPRGRIHPAELETLRGSWHGTFHVEQSITDPLSSILVAHGVASR